VPRALRKVALTAAGVALLAGCAGGDAADARAPAGDNVPAIAGTLTYRLPGGAEHELATPVHGVCVAFDDAAISVDNRTDATAHLRDGCDGPEGDVVIPGAAWDDGNGPPATAVVMLRH
jgi:hypothetical protein